MIRVMTSSQDAARRGDRPDAARRGIRHDAARRRGGTAALALAAVAMLGASVAAVAQSAMPVVGHKDRTYSADLVTVRAGGQVRFDNDDTVAHNVTVRDPSGRQLSWIMLRPGEHTDFTFQAAGDHGVTCAVHPRKRMVVRVT